MQSCGLKKIKILLKECQNASINCMHIWLATRCTIDLHLYVDRLYLLNGSTTARNRANDQIDVTFSGRVAHGYEIFRKPCSQNDFMVLQPCCISCRSKSGTFQLTNCTPNAHQQHTNPTGDVTYI